MSRSNLRKPSLRDLPSRRHFLARSALGGLGGCRLALRGLGVGLGLPALEAMQPATAAAGGQGGPTRMAFVYAPNGVRQDLWRSSGSGRDFQFGSTLEPLEPFRGEVQIVTGLAHRQGVGGADGNGDHARASATILTAARPHKTAGSDIRLGISVDQLAASRVGDATRFASLELSCDGVRKSGACDSGYSCAYQFNISWRSATQPATPESSPRRVFERLFGAGPADERAAGWAARMARDRSVLDFVNDDARRLAGQLGAADRRKLDEYLTSVRDTEVTLAKLERLGMPEVADRDLPDLPDRPPEAYGAYVRLLADLLVLAFQTDSTRIATLMLAHDGSNRSFPEIGVGDGHHDLSHHGGNQEKLDKIARIDRFHVEQFAWFLERLRSTEDLDGRSLLDNSMVVYTSGLSDGNAHRHDDLPTVLAGRGGGRLDPGRLIELPEPRPMANLFVTMLDLMGAPVDRFGDSDGRLDTVCG
jgi:hypothetical protein